MYSYGKTILSVIILLVLVAFSFLFLAWFFGSAANVTSDATLRNHFEELHNNYFIYFMAAIILILALVAVVYFMTRENANLPAL
jgi:uncharacterized membrane protein